MTERTLNGIAILKDCREQLAKGKSLTDTSFGFCDGLSCRYCPLKNMCLLFKDRPQRYKFLEEHYAKYLDNTFTEGETVMINDGNAKPMQATFLYYSQITKQYWVTFKGARFAYAVEDCEKISPIKKVTLSEIEEKFGCKVEIVNNET